MALRTRGPGRERDEDGVSRFGSLRMVLFFLAVVPSLALIALWGVSTTQLALDWRKIAEQDELSDRSVTLAGEVTHQLQEERRLTGEVLADPNTSPGAMRAQRKRTDSAVLAFRRSTDGNTSDLLDLELRAALTEYRDHLLRIDGVRTAADDRTITPQISFQGFTAVIDSNLRFFEALGNADDGGVAVASKPLTDLMWADEMLAREDAALAYGWASGLIGKNERSNLSQWIGTQQFLIDSEITPRLTEDESLDLQRLTGGQAWQTKRVMEQTLLQPHPSDTLTLPREAAQWREAMDALRPQLAQLIRSRTEVVDAARGEAVHGLLVRMVTTSATGLGAVVVVIVLSVLLTRSLRRRILALRDEAARLETELPGVVDRLRRGEDVDADTEVREVRHRGDELGRLGRALNLARRRAVETAVRETEQHRGFQRMLQRIARRTQLLIGLQLKKLDEMERRHEDPQVLEGLFDLDHLTSRLRRYEENLVVLGGGQPQRRWRRPVRVVDVLRAGLGEVQDYRRIRIEVSGDPWLSGRAVGPVVHILAELMENAAAFSKPPNPVDARAALVGKGLVVEVEDRGLGMEPEEYDRVNELMTEPPELDVVSRAEDARLGLYVVARLAAGLGLRVEFRPSAYGGTRAIVLIPSELLGEPAGPADSDSDAGRDTGTGTGGTDTGRTGDSRAEAERTEAPGARPGAGAGTGPADGPPPDETAAGDGGRAAREHPEHTPAAPAAEAAAAPPLPKRVRQAALATELKRPPRRKDREPRASGGGRPGEAEADGRPGRPRPERSGAAIGAFQRQSRLSRGRPALPEDHSPTGGTAPEPGPTTTKDAP